MTEKVFDLRKQMKSDKMYKIGTKCKEVRNRTGFSIYDVAKAVGCTPQYVSKFENGKSGSMLLYNYYITTFNWLESDYEDMRWIY